MRFDTLLTVLLLILTMAQPVFAADVKSNPEDEKLVRQVLKDFVDAGINHDAKALAGLFQPDGDLLTPDGARFSGRTQIENSVTPAQVWSETGPPILRIVRIRFLRPDVAVADAEQVIYGATAWPTPALVMFVFMKEDGRWQIASCRHAASAPSTLQSLSRPF
jgi:uncharacterized protein (TIGR02246 family)